MYEKANTKHVGNKVAAGRARGVTGREWGKHNMLCRESWGCGEGVGGIQQAVQRVGQREWGEYSGLCRVWGVWRGGSGGNSAAAEVAWWAFNTWPQSPPSATFWGPHTGRVLLLSSRDLRAPC